MQDSRGGFMLDDEDERPKGMSLDEWKARLKERQPMIPLDDPNAPKCFECGTVELDFRLYNWFKTRVCRKCRNKNPDKYSLLTKTECREDYLLTDRKFSSEILFYKKGASVLIFSKS
jgi:DNA-repair protein complementing XP-A cells